MDIQSMVEAPLPEIMTVVGNWAQEQGAEPERAFVMAHCAFAALMALDVEGRLERFTITSFLAKTLKDVTGLVWMSDVVISFALISLAAASIFGGVGFLYVSLALLLSQAVITQGIQGQIADRWLGLIDANAKSYEASFLEKVLKPINQPEPAYLTTSEALNAYIDQLVSGSISASELPAYMDGLKPLTTHLPASLKERVIERSQAAVDGNEEALIELYDLKKEFLRPSNVDIGKAAALAIALLAQHGNIALFDHTVTREKAFAWLTPWKIERIEAVLERRGLFVDPVLHKLCKAEWLSHNLGAGQLSPKMLKRLMEEAYPPILEKRSFAA